MCQSFEKNNEQLEMAYQAVVENHNGIADFRAKLLALLPFATGAGVFFLLKEMPETLTVHLTAIGLSGILVTVGLFFYELKNIQKCRALINAGKILERLILENKHELGSFYGSRIEDGTNLPGSKSNDNSRWKRTYISSSAAALLIYSTLIAGWSYLAFFGIWQLLDTYSCSSALTFLRPYSIAYCTGLAAIVFLVTYFLGKETNGKYKAASDEKFKRLKENLIGQ